MILWDANSVKEWFELIGVPKAITQQLPALSKSFGLDGQLLEDIGIDFLEAQKDKFQGTLFFELANNRSFWERLDFFHFHCHSSTWSPGTETQNRRSTKFVFLQLLTHSFQKCLSLMRTCLLKEETLLCSTIARLGTWPTKEVSILFFHSLPFLHNKYLRKKWWSNGRLIQIRVRSREGCFLANYRKIPSIFENSFGVTLAFSVKEM